MDCRSRMMLAAIVLARVGFGFQFQQVATLGPVLMPRFHLDYATLGSLIGVYMLPGVFVALPAGMLGRRLGDGPVLGAGLVLMALGGFISAGVAGLAGMTAGRMVAGLGAVAMSVLQSKVIADWFRAKRFMLAISISTASYPAGVGLSQVVVPRLAARFGLGVPFLVGAVWMVVSAALFAGSYRSAVQAGASGRNVVFPSARECMLLLIGGLTWTSYTGAYAGYLAYLPSLMRERGWGLALTALTATIATWGNAGATLAGGGLAARWGMWPVFLAGSLFLVAGTAGAGGLDWPVLCALLIGLPGSIQSGVIMAVGTLSARAETRAAGMGLFYVVYYVGGAVIPAVCGWAADAYGRAAGAMYAAAAVALLAVPLFMLHRKLSVHEALLKAI
jgi:MFS family permease